MSFLLDTDICSAYLKNDPNVARRVMLHFGGLHVSVITVGELLTWALRAKAPASRLQGVRDLLSASTIHEVDHAVAEKFAETRAALLDQGLVVGEMDLFNAAVALVHQFTMVTHNTADYASVPGLALDDWMAP
jgi:tRNA(fMet)-specific endonuclease VapC